jgi:hypothetical protein
MVPFEYVSAINGLTFVISFVDKTKLLGGVIVFIDDEDVSDEILGDELDILVVENIEGYSKKPFCFDEYGLFNGVDMDGLGIPFVI